MSEVFSNLSTQIYTDKSTKEQQNILIELYFGIMDLLSKNPKKKIIKQKPKQKTNQNKKSELISKVDHLWKIKQFDIHNELHLISTEVLLLQYKIPNSHHTSV